MKAKDIAKIKVTDKTLIITGKDGKTKRMKRTIPMMQFIDALLNKGLLKYEQIENKSKRK